MIPKLLSDEVLTVEADEACWRGSLLSLEESLVAKAVPKRRREFTAGRNCARRALAQLGYPDFALLAGSHGQPLWPPGIAGSITHCDDYCAVAVAPVSI